MSSSEDNPGSNQAASAKAVSIVAAAVVNFVKDDRPWKSGPICVHPSDDMRGYYVIVWIDRWQGRTVEGE
jgi:hypothetical protein